MFIGSGEQLWDRVGAGVTGGADEGSNPVGAEVIGGDDEGGVEAELSDAVTKVV